MGDEPTRSACSGRYTLEELRRRRGDVRGVANAVRGVNPAGVYRAPCYVLAIEAESIRPHVDRELRRRDVPLNAVEVPVVEISQW